VTCDRRRISYYLDGELSPDERSALLEHLRDCETCAAALSAYRAIGRRIRRDSDPILPAEVAERLRRRARSSLN
jgi:anti-sigma factor RsiW